MFLPNKIDLGCSEKYILSIRIKADSFMFSITDPENDANYCFRETELAVDQTLLENIQRIVFDFNFLTQHFRETNVVFVSSEYEIIPRHYDVSKKREAMYQFSHTENEEDISKILMSSENVDQQTVTLYPMNKALYEFLSRSLYNPVFYHHSQLLMKCFYDKSGVVDAANRMYLYFHEKQMDVFCFSGQKLMHAIGFQEGTERENLYYALKMWESVAFDQHNDQVFIAGRCDREIASCLKEYIRHVAAYSLPSEVFLWNGDASKAPLDLLMLSL